MPENFGGWLAKREVSPTFTYMAMVLEYKHLQKDVGGLHDDHASLKKDIHDHDIERIQKDFTSMQEEYDGADIHSYKFGFRNLVLERMELNKQRMLGRLIHRVYGQDNAKLKAVFTKIGSKKVHEQADKLLEQEHHLDEYVAERRRILSHQVHDEIKGEWKGTLNIQAVMEGKTAVGLTFKKDPTGFVQLMNLRWGAIRGLRREIFSVEKNEKDLKTRAKISIGLHDKLLKVSQGHGRKVDKMVAKLLKKEGEIEKDVLKEWKELFEHSEKIIKHTYKIFIFDLLLIRAIVEMLNSDDATDHQLLVDHGIPEMMGKTSIEELQKDKKHIQAHVDNLQKFLLQLSSKNK